MANKQADDGWICFLLSGADFWRNLRQRLYGENDSGRQKVYAGQYTTAPLRWREGHASGDDPGEQGNAAENGIRDV